MLGIFDIIGRWLMWCGVAVFGTILLIGFYDAFRARASSWEPRLDSDGVTAHGCSTTSWSDLAEVRVTRMGPRWFFLALGLQIVVFIGRLGVEVPSLPSVRAGILAKRSARLRARLYGTPLVLIPQTFDAPIETIVATVERFSDVPVIGDLPLHSCSRLSVQPRLLTDPLPDSAADPRKGSFGQRPGFRGSGAAALAAFLDPPLQRFG